MGLCEKYAREIIKSLGLRPSSFSHLIVNIRSFGSARRIDVVLSVSSSWWQEWRSYRLIVTDRPFRRFIIRYDYATRHLVSTVYRL